MPLEALAKFRDQILLQEPVLEIVFALSPPLGEHSLKKDHVIEKCMICLHAGSNHVSFVTCKIFHILHLLKMNYSLERNFHEKT